MAEDRSFTGKIVRAILFNPVSKGLALGAGLYASGVAGYHIGNILHENDLPNCGESFRTALETHADADTLAGGEIKFEDGTACRLTFDH